MRIIARESTAYLPLGDALLDTTTVYGDPPDTEDEERRERDGRERLRRYNLARVFRSSTDPSHHKRLLDDLREGERDGVAEVESGGTRVVTCAACAKRFTNRATLARHLFNFPVCRTWTRGMGERPATPSRVRDVREVRAVSATNGSHPAQCEESDEDSTSESGEYGPRAKSNECIACGRAFSSTDALDLHMSASPCCQQWRADDVVAKLASASRRVVDMQIADKEAGQVWEFVNPGVARDVIAYAGVRS